MTSLVEHKSVTREQGTRAKSTCKAAGLISGGQEVTGEQGSTSTPAQV